MSQMVPCDQLIFMLASYIYVTLVNFSDYTVTALASSQTLWFKYLNLGQPNQALAQLVRAKKKKNPKPTRVSNIRKCSQQQTCGCACRMGFLTQKVEHQHAKLKVSGSTATKQRLKPLNWFGWVRVILLLGLIRVTQGQV